MVQGIQNQKAINATNGINYDNGGMVYYAAQGQKHDSFNGKTLLTIAGIAGAVIFRKNIASFVQKHFPKVAEFFGKNISTPTKNFFAKHKENFIIKFFTKAKDTFLNAEQKVYNFFNKSKPANTNQFILTQNKELLNNTNISITNPF